MIKNKDHWDLIILDGGKYTANDNRLYDIICGDFDGDGKTEIITANTWYRMANGERGNLAQRLYFDNVQPAVGDIDGDGLPEIVCSSQDPDHNGIWIIYWYKPSKNISDPWEMHVLSPDHKAQPHDIIIADIDGDGQNEVIAVGVYDLPITQGLYIYKKGDDITQPWKRHTVSTGLYADGTVAVDLDNDGIMEIVSGPILYKAPSEGPYSGPWLQQHLATGFRPLCRAVASDITGTGRADIVMIEAEYPDCRLSWFENRILENPDNPWIEHSLDEGLKASHTLDTWKDGSGIIHIFTAETENGTGVIYNYGARLMEYSTSDQGKTWEETEIYKGQGTWMAWAKDVDDDGEVEIFGGTDCEFGSVGVHVWKKHKSSLPVSFKTTLIDLEKPYPSTAMLIADVDGDGFEDIICGAFWYKSTDWKRYEIPGIYQIVAVGDIDGDGQIEFFGTKEKLVNSENMEDKLSGELVWLKPIDAKNGVWEEYNIGIAQESGKGSQKTRATFVPNLLPDGRAALIAQSGGAMQLFELPSNPKERPWLKREFSEADGCTPRMIPYDMMGNGRTDLVTCWNWLENMGDGTFRKHPITDKYDEQTCLTGWRGDAQVLCDITGNGSMDLISCENSEFSIPYTKEGKFSRLAWFENPGKGDPIQWTMHIIDWINSPNSIAVYDFDGDGIDEIIVGEHDLRNDIYYCHNRLFMYKRADSHGLSWIRYVIDDRFDHNEGVKLITLPNGKKGIASQGSRERPVDWLSRDSRWVHVYEPI